jgi:hypothetical protein
MKRWRGLKALVQDAVDHGSKAIERVQKETAARPFAILEQMPDIGGPAKVVHVLHDAAVTGVHGAIRVVNKVVGASADAAFDAIEQKSESPKAPDEPK